MRRGVILSGGQGRRLGGVDKGEIRLCGKRLIDHVYERLSPQVSEVWISGSHDYGLGLSYIPDKHDAPKGPLGGLYSIHLHTKQNAHDGFLTVPVDGPFLPENLYERLTDTNQSSFATTPSRIHPTYAYWKTKDLDVGLIEMASVSDNSLKGLVKTVNATPVNFRDEDRFMNINSHEDFEAAKNILQISLS